MVAKSLRLAGLVLFVLASVPAQAQVGHPLKGSWLGYWGPDDDTQRRMLLLMDWDEREIHATINPGPRAVRVDRAEMDYENWTLTLEADMPKAEGGTERWVATGKVENLGSWQNRRYSGTYRFGGETGAFTLTLH